MKNRHYLIDTNILIYYFNGLIADRYIDRILEESFCISIISKIEFLSWSKLYDDKRLASKADEFISYATIYHLSDEIADRTIEIRRRFKVKTPDAIIAATAMVHGFDILTNNVDDFRFPDLQIRSLSIR